MKKTREMAYIAIFSAVIIAFSFIPFTGYITYGGIAITTLHIPVFIIGVVLGKKEGAIMGFVWGIACLVRAFMEPLPTNVPFQNPLISVLPRIIVGFLAGYLHELFTRKNENHLSLKMGLVFFISTTLHTLLVISMLWLFKDLLLPNFAEFLLIVFTLNYGIEVALAIIVGTIVSIRLIKYRKAVTYDSTN